MRFSNYTLDPALEIRRLFPTVAILVLSMQDREQLVDEAKKIGITGPATKLRTVALLNAEDAVLRNEGLFPSQ